MRLRARDLAGKPDDERQLMQLLASVEEAVDALTNGILLDPETDSGKRAPMTAIELLRRAKSGRAAGFPPSSGLRADGGPGSVLDDEEVPMPPVADPVGELAVRDPERDDVKEAVSTIVSSLKTCKGKLEGAVSAMQHATPKAPPPGQPGCRSCAQINDFSPVHAGAPSSERCQFCFDWWRANGQDPPVAVLEYRKRYGRVTNRVLEQLDVQATIGRAARQGQGKC